LDGRGIVLEFPELNRYGPKSVLKLSEINMEINDLRMDDVKLRAAGCKQARAVSFGSGMNGSLILQKITKGTKKFSTSFALFPSVQGLSFFLLLFVPL
jgi:hypothetical protein